MFVLTWAELSVPATCAGEHLHIIYDFCIISASLFVKLCVISLHIIDYIYFYLIIIRIKRGFLKLFLG